MIPQTGRIVCGYSFDEEAGGQGSDASGSKHLIALPRKFGEWGRSERNLWLRKEGLVLTIAGGTKYGMFEMGRPWMNADAVAVTAAAQTALTPDVIFTLPGNWWTEVGQRAWFRVMGKQSNVITTPGTYLFRLFYGGIAGTALVASAGITPAPVAHTDNMWYADMWIECVALNSGLATGLTLLAYGQVEMTTMLVPTTQALFDAPYMPPRLTALANVASLDPTTAKALTLAVTPTVATGSITARSAWLTSPN